MPALSQTRYLPEDYFQVAFSILQGARSISSAVRSLKLLDLPLTQEYLMWLWGLVWKARRRPPCPAFLPEPGGPQANIDK
ncbi:MAG: hypothetical protein DSZ24_03915 [Thermodesulfatator sp.]|nr:MAG: hypothetical protein DSZ24_03915 [Thermodesulfatator sp.]